jgi:hypothetical protein
MLLIFSRIALLSALTATAVNAMDCLTHESCRKIICVAFDDVCPDEQPVCEQLSEDPWFNCHAANVVTEKVPEVVEAPNVKLNGCDLTCHESAVCTTDGTVEFCICKDGRLVPEGLPCADWKPPRRNFRVRVLPQPSLTPPRRNFTAKSVVTAKLATKLMGTAGRRVATAMACPSILGTLAKNLS